MSVQSRIVSFSLADGEETNRANTMLTGFLSEGWDLVGSGGSDGFGFLVFVKWTDDKAVVGGRQSPPRPRLKPDEPPQPCFCDRREGVLPVNMG